MNIAINKAFSDFDLDGSGMIDRCEYMCVCVNSHLRPWTMTCGHAYPRRNEFQQAMHTLGLRLNGEQYEALFQVCLYGCVCVVRALCVRCVCVCVVKDYVTHKRTGL